MTDEATPSGSDRPRGRAPRPRRRPRRAQRLVHLVAALPVLAYVYATPTSDALLTTAVRGVVVPLLVVSGLLLWQAPRLRRLRARWGRALAA